MKAINYFETSLTHNLVPSQVLETDFGLAIFGLLFDMGIEVCKRLYSMFPYFRDLFNSKRILDYFTNKYGIILPIMSGKPNKMLQDLFQITYFPNHHTFPQFCCQYEIKWECKQENSNFSLSFALEVALENDNVEAYEMSKEQHGKVYCLERAIEKNKPNLVKHLSNFSSCRDFLYGYHGTLLDLWTNSGGRSGFLRANNIILGILSATHRPSRYREALDFAVKSLPQHNYRYFTRIYTRHVTEQSNYKDCIRLLEMCYTMPEFSMYKKFAYARCCTTLASKDRIDDIKQLIQDGYLTMEQVKKIAFDTNFWSEYGMSKDVWNFVGWDLPQIVDGCLTTLLYDPNHPGLKGYNLIYHKSVIELISGLHQNIENFTIGQEVYDAIIRSKDVLTRKYVEKHDLYKRQEEQEQI